MPSNILFINFEFPGHKYASLHNAQSCFMDTWEGNLLPPSLARFNRSKLLRNSWTDLSDMDLTPGAHETHRAVLPENRSEATATDGQISTLRVFRDPSTGLLPVPFCWRRRQEAALEPSPDSTESVWQRSLESWCNCVKFGHLSKTRNLYLKNCLYQDFPRFIILIFFFYFLKVQSCGQKNQVRNE